MSDGIRFSVPELRRANQRILERRIRSYANQDRDLYDHLMYYLQLAIENSEGMLRSYTHVRINRNGVQVPSRSMGNKGGHSFYTNFPLV
ncbi:MAG: hypothetical protein HYW22_02630 [Candidatus Aenigmarchaeota archaeon]|nr:hypothetical protein [Candidatus Aenigmarchaeota archaeon]